MNPGTNRLSIYLHNQPSEVTPDSNPIGMLIDLNSRFSSQNFDPAENDPERRAQQLMDYLRKLKEELGFVRHTVTAVYETGSPSAISQSEKGLKFSSSQSDDPIEKLASTLENVNRTGHGSEADLDRIKQLGTELLGQLFHAKAYLSSSLLSQSPQVKRALDEIARAESALNELLAENITLKHIREQGRVTRSQYALVC